METDASAEPGIRVPASFPRPGDVRGLRVVVTGGGKGLGLVVAAAFAAAGARVAVMGRDAAALDDVAARLEGDVLADPGDVSEPDDNEAVADRVVEAWGGLDVWIANAGVSPVVGGPLRTTPDQWRQVIDVNLSGVFYGARAAARVMEGDGCIIATSSVLGHRPQRGFSAYSAAKAGVLGLVQALALDLAPNGIRVNAVSPGWFDSPLTTDWQADPKLERRILDHTAMRRWGASEDLPGAYLFLASPAARFVTGTVLVVDGGYLAV